MTPVLPTGYRDACECAKKVLTEGAFNNCADPERFRLDLLNIAKTTLSSKILTVVRGGEGLHEATHQATCTLEYPCHLTARCLHSGPMHAMQPHPSTAQQQFWTTSLLMQLSTICLFRPSVALLALSAKLMNAPEGFSVLAHTYTTVTINDLHNFGGVLYEIFIQRV